MQLYLLYHNMIGFISGFALRKVHNVDEALISAFAPAPKFSTDIEIIKFLGYQHTGILGVKELCTIESLSCDGKCGDFMKNIDYPVDTSLCSCDVLCSYYGDCCWDVQDVCGFQRQYQHPSTSPTVECERGRAIITGSNDKPDSTTPVDHRESIVTRKSSPGLHFKNETVYRYFFDDASVAESALRWNKAFEPTEEVPFREIQLFFLEGQLEENLTQFLIDIPPTTITTRRCQPSYAEIKCRGQGNGIIVPDANDICSNVIKGAADFHTTTIRPTTIPTPKSVFRGEFTKETTTPMSALEDFTKETAEGDSFTDRAIPGEFTTGTCFIRPGYIDDNAHLGVAVLSIFMSFSQTGSIQVNAVSKLGSSLLDYKFKSNNDTEDGSRDLVMVCAAGFVPNNEDCASPISLMIHLTGVKPRLHLKNTLQSITQEAIRHFNDSDLELGKKHPNVGERSVNGVSRMWTQIEILRYSLEYDNQRLPVTEELIRILEFHKFQGVDQIIVCFVVPTHVHQNDSILICDKISSHINIKHFTVQSIDVTYFLEMGEPGVENGGGNDSGMNQAFSFTLIALFVIQMLTSLSYYDTCEKMVI